ncbi:MAG: UDP-2,4-diacetamido-2,4,6-trideoxy-beta-L-altropyranose hydrolase [Bacteriovoracaceae bacterium]
MSKNILFRVDSSFKLGSGHLVRCLTLAQQILKTTTNTITFITRKDDGNFNHLIKNNPEIKIIELPTEPDFDIKDDSIKTAEILKSFNSVDLLIIDHYQIDITWELVVQNHTKKIMVIDDLYNREHSCDFLLDQNIINLTNPYSNLVKKACTFFLGPSYALLREQFLDQKKQMNELANLETINSILLFFGGSDPENETIKAIIAVTSMNFKKIRCIVPNNFKVKEFIKNFEQHENIEFLSNVQDMASLLINTDLYVGAGGSITWERCCLGVTGVVVSIADNQTEIAEQLDQQKFHYYLGTTKEVTVTSYIRTISEIIANLDELNNYRRKSFQLVDGLGVEKIVESIL